MGCGCSRVRVDKETTPGKKEKTSDIPGAILSGPEKVKPDDIDALLTVDLPESVILNIKRWWKGEISGMRCVKTILDLGVRIAAGYVGTTVGGYIPVPNGAMIGATAGKFAAEYLRNLLTKWVFDLPQSEALENALTFLNVSPNASNSEINSQYKRLARKYRPNKGGDTENWTRLQYSMAVIKEWRGNL